MTAPDFITGLPKAELHLHIEGSLEPELMFALAERNKVAIPFKSVEEVRAAYNFSNLQDFLDIYYAGADVLRTEADFGDLATAYFDRAAADGVVHAEIFFDPQTHTDRGIPFQVAADGLLAGMADAQATHGLTSKLILCFLRHLDEDAAFATLQAAEPWLDRIAGVGLDSSEVGHPPSKFARVFAAAGEMGLKRVAHAGEEGPPEYVHEALDLLRIDRLDHGNRSLEDPGLTTRLAREAMTLTVCPLSNVKLCNVASIDAHPIAEMLRKGLRATVNSDDPAYFGGYIGDNFRAIAPLVDREDVVTLARNSFLGSFLPDVAVAKHVAALGHLCGGLLMPTFTPFEHDDFVAAVRGLAARIDNDDWQPDFIIGIGRGGLTPAVFLSHATGVPMLSVDVSAPVPEFNGELLTKLADRTRSGEKLLFVDDINDSGRTISALRAGLRAAGGNIDATRFAVLIDNVSSAERVEYGHRRIDRTTNKDWFVFPWEAMAPAESIADDAAEVPERIA